MTALEDAFGCECAGGFARFVHVHHDRVTSWFLRRHRQGWATCSITEKGLIRVVSELSYQNLRITPLQAADSLRQLRKHYADSHTFWPCDVSLTDQGRFDLAQISSSKQTTDVFLAGLAFSKGARLGTLDANVAWKAVRNATANLIEPI